MKLKLILITTILGLILPAQQAMASFTITVSGNGSGASNQVNLNNTNTTTVYQNNESAIENNIDSNLNTGNNQASSNGGEVQIETGDIVEVINLENLANISTVELGGGQAGDYEIVVIDNGADSTNQVNLNTTNQTLVSVNNNAVITNTIRTNANTGNNQANHNEGNVLIDTGDIEVIVSVQTLANLNRVRVGTPVANVDAKISGNGADSVNQISVSDAYVLAIYQANNAQVDNNYYLDFNTGNNQADHNLGAVQLTTGDINAVITTSTRVNENSIEKGDVKPCDDNNPDNPGDDDDDHEPEIPPVTPPSNGGNGSNGNNGGGGGGGNGDNNGVGGNSNQSGDVLGAMDMLPATGSFTTLLMIIGNLLMLMLGCYLRLRSGRSPNYAFAY